MKIKNKMPCHRPVKWGKNKTSPRTCSVTGRGWLFSAMEKKLFKLKRAVPYGVAKRVQTCIACSLALTPLLALASSNKAEHVVNAENEENEEEKKCHFLV